MMSRRHRRGKHSLITISEVPKKKTLFSFIARNGEEFPSDSEDSDYHPGRVSSDGDDEFVMMSLEKTKEKAKKKFSERLSSSSRKRTTRTSAKAKGETGNSKHSNLEVQINLPPEILLRIFQLSVANEGVGSVIPRISRVCRAWHALSCDVSLWRWLDLSRDKVALTNERVENLLKKDLSHCIYLSLEGQKKVPLRLIKKLLKKMPNLISLDLSDCANVKSVLIKEDIVNFCPNLERLDISSPHEKNQEINFPAVRTWIEHCGVRLKELRMNELKFTGPSCFCILNALAKHCPNIEELDIGCSAYLSRYSQYSSTFFIKACPMLKELRLDGQNFLEMDPCDEEMRDGIPPQLKHLQVYSQCSHLNLTDKKSMFYNMFPGVSRLTELTICCSNLLPSGITFQVKAVDNLNLRSMVWNDEEQSDLLECIDAWGGTLKTLDISHNIFSNNMIDTALCRFGGFDCDLPLESLHLSNTNVTPVGVVEVLKACKKLQTIDLTSCRDLPRGSKRIFKQKELESLLEFLQKHLAEQSDSEN